MVSIARTRPLIMQHRQSLAIAMRTMLCFNRSHATPHYATRTVLEHVKPMHNEFQSLARDPSLCNLRAMSGCRVMQQMCFNRSHATPHYATTSYRYLRSHHALGFNRSHATPHYATRVRLVSAIDVVVSIARTRPLIMQQAIADVSIARTRPLIMQLLSHCQRQILEHVSIARTRPLIMQLVPMLPQCCDS